MDLSGIAALCALAGIPVTVLLARWQKRTALNQSEASHQTAMAQAEAGHRTAMAQAEAGHRAALEVAEVSHRNALEAAERAHRHALELAQQQERSQRDRWRRESLYATYENYQSALDRFRLMLADESAFLFEGWQVIHHVEHRFPMIGAGSEASSIASELTRRCEAIAMRHSMSVQERHNRWRTHVRPLRADFDAAVARELGHEPASPRQRPRA
ncbi:hypothetical protein [Streptomyces mirabilis]|uniref:hypothetical protein n=1 Tax=Streptomyces mirabilis TaxID=68239 RepID=UPI002252885F|nr:hypothetical protein [Streptomyces mirabilis]MCX4429517.1 hypothetical protein [Streptomyces mirabilis]